MHEVIFPGRSRHPGSLLLVLGLHLVLGILLLRSGVVLDKPLSTSRLDLFFVTPLPAIPKPPPAPLTREYASKPAPPVRSSVESPEPAAAIPVQAAPEPILSAQPETPARAVDTAALIAMAGKLDKEVRQPGENLLSGAGGQSLRRKMDEAFAAAHLAVPLKWYEAARVELWSAENDPAKIYQVKTAFGTYCLFYADRLKNPDASPQPRISACPKRF